MDRRHHHHLRAECNAHPFARPIDPHGQRHNYVLRELVDGVIRSLNTGHITRAAAEAELLVLRLDPARAAQITSEQRCTYCAMTGHIAANCPYREARQ